MKASQRAIVILTLIALVLITLSVRLFKETTAQHKPFKKDQIALQISPTLISTPTPTPTPTLTPTPQPSGFCLRVPILLYHHIQPTEDAKNKKQTSINVDPDFFEKQMAYLNSAGYTTISVEQLAQALISHQSLGSKQIVLTFDDGYSDFRQYAYPIIQKFHMVANLMIPTGLMENPGYLKWTELKEMVDSGLVFAYDHSWSHSALGFASEDKIQYEVLTAKSQLEQHLGKNVTIFAYPYGSENSRVENILRLNGFIAALSTQSGFLQCDSFLMSLHRNRVGNASLSAYGL